MGFGNGMSIGWPMTSSSRGANLAYFSIADRCFEPVVVGWTTQLVDTSIYHTGDYVMGVDGKGNEFRWLLGEIVLEPGTSIIEISGQTYNSCPIYKTFAISGSCSGQLIIGCTTPIDITYYNTGDYVYAPDFNTRVILGNIIPEGEECIANYLVEGPKYNSCGVNPPFTGYFGFQEYCNGTINMTTQYYGPTTQTWQIGQVVRNMDSVFENNYVIISDIRAEGTGSVTLVGPALNGCPIP